VNVSIPCAVNPSSSEIAIPSAARRIDGRQNARRGRPLRWHGHRRRPRRAIIRWPPGPPSFHPPQDEDGEIVEAPPRRGEVMDRVDVIGLLTSARFAVKVRSRS